MTKGPRDGVRKGAGRPRKLTVVQGLWIGTEAAKRIAECAPSMIEQAVTQGAISPATIHRWEVLKNLPVAERQKWKRIVTTYGFNSDNDETLITELILDNRSVTAAIGHVKLAPKRPYGVRTNILKEVAEAATQRYGRKVSVRTVRDCLDEYRAIEKRLAAST